MSTDLRRISGLWERTAKKTGRRFWSGSLDARGMEALVELARGGRVRLLLFEADNPAEGEAALRLCAAPDDRPPRAEAPAGRAPAEARR